MIDLNPVPQVPARPIPFAIIGWGWRSRQFAEIAARLPAWFRLTGVMRRRASGDEGVATVTSLRDLLAGQPRFVLLSVPRAHTPAYLHDLVEAQQAVLAETPPAADLPGMSRLFAELPPQARIQVAEQYPFQPYHQAVARLQRSGLLGDPTHAFVSMGHGYHGIALMRQFLGLGRRPVRIRAMAHVAPVVGGPGRDGPPQQEEIRQVRQLLALLDFGDRSGVFDFVGEQYFSWIRSSRLLVRGVRGEMADDTVRTLADCRTPLRQRLERWQGGERTNLEGLALQGYSVGGEWVYRNPFGAVPLPDDHIAMATVLWRMAHYLETGEAFYTLADACFDHHVGTFALEESIASGREVLLEGFPWVEA